DVVALGVHAVEMRLQSYQAAIRRVLEFWSQRNVRIHVTKIMLVDAKFFQKQVLVSEPTIVAGSNVEGACEGAREAGLCFETSLLRDLQDALVRRHQGYACIGEASSTHIRLQRFVGNRLENPLEV